MPLADLTYSHRAVWPYLWNPLPENPNVLQRWSQQFHVSANSPFKLLQFVGADVPVPRNSSRQTRERQSKRNKHLRSIGSAWMNSPSASRNCAPMPRPCAAQVTAAR
jgi:hypothetical protein